MSNNIVAIIGKPNVGKSTLFNKLIGERKSIIDDTPGVTRDRVYGEVTWRDKTFTLIDTGGLQTSSDDNFSSQIKEQAQAAIELADTIIFLVDSKTGITPDDQEIAMMLKKSNKDIILVCNKIDDFETMQANIYEFYNLGLGDPYPLSAEHSKGFGDILDIIYDKIDSSDSSSNEDKIKVAVIGKPNVGKSSLINKILNENRLIVSDVAGTTRDSVDSFLKNEYGDYIFIDTAGIRRHSKVEENIEKYSILRSKVAIDKSDVCLVLIDATEGITEQDAKIAGLAHEAGKAIILVINKWDLYDKNEKTLEKYEDEIYARLKFLNYAPTLFISSKTGQRVNKLFPLINEVYANNSMRIQTSVINDILEEAVSNVEPPSDKGRRLKLYYMTQVAVNPPTFAIFVNSKKLFHFSYERYIINQIRKRFGFIGTTIRIYIREKGEK